MNARWPMPAEESATPDLSPRLLALLLLVLVGAEAQAARVVSEKRECATCHIAWMADFKRSDVATLIPNEPRPVEKSGRQDVVSTERMCFSCHDGFVLDSRFYWREGAGHSHPVGVAPSEKVQIPKEEGKEIFPLNDDGKVYCGTCHSAHGVEWGDNLSPIFLRTRNIDSSLCTKCHQDRQGARGGHPNHPLGGEVPEGGRKLAEAGAKFGSGQTVVCQSCHRVHGAREKKLLVNDNGRSQLCETCHSDKSAGEANGGKGHFTHPVDVVPKEASIPATLRSAGARLGPKGELICQTCHGVHLAPAGKLLRMDPERHRDGVCVLCHEKQRTLLESGHNVMQSAGQGAKPPDGAAGACGACHRAHQGQGPKMWARQLAARGDRVAALCLSCHDKGGLAEQLGVGKYSHPVGVPLPEGATATDLPLYTPTGRKSHAAGEGRVSCPTCHDVHGAAATDKSTGAKDGATRGKYLRKGERDAQELCRGCHEEKWLVTGTRHDLNGKGAAGGHGRQPLGTCGNCHQVHNGKGPRMWARKGLARDDDPSALCNDCHRPGGEAEGKSVGRHSHPVGVPVGNAGVKVSSKGWVAPGPDGKPTRVATLPLYDAHGGKTQEGGAVSCATCHDPHRWSPADQTGGDSGTQQKEGGPTSSFLRIAETGPEGLCVNCHAEKGAVFGTRHDLENGQSGKDRAGAQEGAGSACLGCHTPHNANGANLWKRASGAGKGGVEPLCKACHKADGLAKKHAVDGLSHPLGVRPANSAAGSGLPLFDGDGRKIAHGGTVGCATCHDPHRWSPAEATDSGGAGAEGDGRNSFLRRPAAPGGELCVACHKEKAAVRGTDHDLAVTAPDARNVVGEVAAQSGVCGQCHAAHNSVQGLALWAQAPGSGENGLDRLCRSCHSGDGVASGKVPARAQHPGFVQAWSSALRDEAPKDSAGIEVFSVSGRRAPTGHIACPSCHDAHRWRADGTGEGSGGNEEGDVYSSFLRLSTTEGFLCADCHGPDALFRYKYFHGTGRNADDPVGDRGASSP